MIAMASSAMAADKYTGGPCTVGELMTAIHKSCGGKVEWTNGEISYYQGENTDTYLVPVTVGDKEIAVRTDSGSCTFLDVRSVCPSDGK